MITVTNPPPVYRSITSINLRKAGVVSTNPLVISKSGPASSLPINDGEILVDAKQIDKTVYELNVVDEDGMMRTFDLVVPP
jgi:hypothetical protein